VTDVHDSRSEPAFSAGDCVGAYRLVRVVGTGAMGSVFEAEGPSGRVAVKALAKSGGWHDVQQRARFLREAAVCQKLKSPNVVPVLDHGIDPKTDTPYLVMPLLDGEDLATIIGRLGALEPDVAVRLFVQAARGLAVAHAAGVIHRDVKPSNLYVDKSASGALTLKVCDFGLAKATFEPADSLTTSGTFLGTPHYVSPEQATNAKRVDARSDVWSLAMTLYHTLAGVPAFGHIDNVAALVFELTAGNVKPLQDAAPWIDPRLARVVHGALILDQDARCPSMAELAKALSAIAGDDEITTVRKDALAPASEATRTRSAPRAELPSSWKEVAVDEDDDSHEMIGRAIGAKYTLVRIIGRGGMGTVFEATTPSGERFALKMIRSEIARRSRDAMRRFLREAKTAQTIDSEHVTKVVDSGIDENGAPYIVMELLHGADLGKVMRDHGALEETPIVPVFVQACRGLAAAHALGVVHRDIKPANIFLHQRPDGTVVAKLCDFGVAKQTTGAELEDATTDLTRTGGMLGSPIYMSPEQAQNAKNVDHRTDLWSLAITMYQALSGQRPWQGCTTMGELILAICTKNVTPIAEIAPWIDPKLAAVVHRALVRDVSARWSSAEEMAAALEPLGAAAPTLKMSTLVPVSGERRAHSVPPTARSAAVTLAESISTDAHVSTARTPRRGRSRRVAVVAAIAVVGTAAAFSFARRGSEVTPTTAARPPGESFVGMELGVQSEAPTAGETASARAPDAESPAAPSPPSAPSAETPKLTGHAPIPRGAPEAPSARPSATPVTSAAPPGSALPELKKSW
jgi:serine/threonine protein kinase